MIMKAVLSSQFFSSLTFTALLIMNPTRQRRKQNKQEISILLLIPKHAWQLEKCPLGKMNQTVREHE